VQGSERLRGCGWACIYSAFLGCAAVDEDTGTSFDDTAALEAPLAITDVVVVGGGAAGLSAALIARETGADVLLLEMSDELGGAARYAQTLLFSGSPQQVEAGVEDSPEALIEDWPSFTGGDAGNPWLEQYAALNVAEVMDWLESLGLGLEFLGETLFASGSVPRLHQLSTSTAPLTEVLASHLDAHDFRMQTEVTGLIAQDGRVIGVQIASEKNGDSGWVEAKTVVMATGSFLRDHERFREVRPDLVGIELLNASAPMTDGAGLTMIEGVGGTTKNLAAVGLYLHGTLDPRKGSEGEELAIDGLNDGIWINGEAQRFFNESEFNSFRPAETVVSSVDGVVWLVVDNREPTVVVDPMKEDHETEEVFLSDLVAAGVAAEAATLEELATAISVNPTTFESTVDDYNLFANGEKADEWRTGLESGESIEHSPFRAVRLFPSTSKAFGGVAVDLDGRVVDSDGLAIPGLFAAGELTGMAGGSLVGSLGFAGSLSAVLLSGKIAGHTAGLEAINAR